MRSPGTERFGASIIDPRVGVLMEVGASTTMGWVGGMGVGGSH